VIVIHIRGNKGRGSSLVGDLRNSRKVWLYSALGGEEGGLSHSEMCNEFRKGVGPGFNLEGRIFLLL